MFVLPGLPIIQIGPVDDIIFPLIPPLTYVTYIFIGHSVIMVAEIIEDKAYKLGNFEFCAN